MRRASFLGSSDSIGKSWQRGILFPGKGWKMEEYCMYFPFFELKKWDKKTAEARRHNCAALP